jgi:hypothetical protein
MADLEVCRHLPTGKLAVARTSGGGGEPRPGPGFPTPPIVFPEKQKQREKT